MKKLLAAALLAFSACKEKPAPAPVSDEPPVLSVAAGLEMISYQEPSGAFSLQGPADWQVREDDSLGPSVSLLGPGSREFPGSVSIRVSRYPNPVDRSPDPKHYYDAMTLSEEIEVLQPLGKHTLGGREVVGYSWVKPFRKLHERKTAWKMRQFHAEIPFEGGFYSLVYSAPVEIYKDALPVFEAVVASFKPGAPPARKP